MKQTRVEIRRRLEEFEGACRKAGFKLTHQRREVFREVVGNDEHPDAETVFRAVRRRVPTVSRDTVYRTLWMLTTLEVINVLGPSKDRIRFDSNPEPHHHFICSKCGLTSDFQSRALDELPIPASVRSLGSIKIVQVEVRGICAACESRPQARNKRKRKEGKRS